MKKFILTPLDHSPTQGLQASPYARVTGKFNRDQGHILMSTTPLEGLKVLELGSLIVGLFATGCSPSLALK